MKNIVTKCLIVLMLASCTSTANTVAAPNFYNGRYYMAGDASCTQINQISEGRIMCVNAAGVQTGYRDAMTDQQIQMYQHSQQMQVMQAQLAQQQAAQSAQQTAAWANSMQQSYPQYTAPQVMPLSLPGSGQVRCINTGIYTNCRY